MKKWYLWLVLAFVWILGGVMNYFDGRSIASSIVVTGIFTFLGVAQLICDKKGETGKRIFQFISISVLALSVLTALILFIIMFA